MKKFFKIIGLTLVVLILALISIPFLFKDIIKEKVMTAINESVDAQISFSDFSLNLFKNFPNANVELDGLKVINNAPFEGDTLAFADKLSVKINLKDILLKSSNEPYKLLGFFLENAIVNIRMNTEGKGNFDIAKSTNETETEESSSPSNFSLNIQEYSIDNLRFTFKDDNSKMVAILDSLYHSGKGNFAEQVLDLETTTKTKVTFVSDGNSFLKNTNISIDAILGIDLNNQKYTLKNNTAHINQLALNFDGFVQLLEDGQLYNLTFKTPTTSFQNFLDLVPKSYTKSMEGVQTKGEFTVNGVIDGKYTDKTIPKLDIRLLSNNASFQYPSLPKSVKNINIDIKIGNDTEKLDDTYVNINNFAFTIDQDAFSVKSNIKNLIKNPFINAELKGTINLENIQKAYPIDMDLDLKGIFKADIITAFDMASIEKKQYENIKNSGNASLENFTYTGAGFVQPFHIEKAGISFNTSKIELSSFDAKTGKTDLNLKGNLENFYGFIFRNEVLKGDFSLNSNLINVGDFMQKETASTTSETPASNEENKENSTTKTEIKIPAFLDCTFNALAKTVIYDNLTLKNVSGKLVVKDEKVDLQNLQTDIFDGKTAISGNVSTKGDASTFEVSLDMNHLNVIQSFTQIEMLKKILPIAKVVEGFFSSKINVSGKLTPELTPDLNSLSGNLSATLSDSRVKDTSPLISALDSQFNKLNLSKLNLNDIKANLTFENGKVVIKPFDIKWNNSTIQVAGTHGFDQSMNYNLTFNVPPSMLGGEAEGILSKLTNTEQQKLGNIPVNVVVGGDFSKPKLSTDMKQAVGNLTQQIVKAQANKLTNKVVDEVSSKATDLLGKALGGKTEATQDSTKTQTKQQVQKAVNNVLNGLFSRKKDTTNSK